MSAFILSLHSSFIKLCFLLLLFSLRLDKRSLICRSSSRYIVNSLAWLAFFFVLQIGRLLHRTGSTGSPIFCLSWKVVIAKVLSALRGSEDSAVKELMHTRSVHIARRVKQRVHNFCPLYLGNMMSFTTPIFSRSVADLICLIHGFPPFDNLGDLELQPQHPCDLHYDFPLQGIDQPSYGCWWFIPSPCPSACWPLCACITLCDPDRGSCSFVVLPCVVWVER